MTAPSRRVAGILLVIMPPVVLGGASVLTLLVNDPYADNALRQDLWRAGHAHGGVLLVLSLIALRYVDEATLAEHTCWACAPRLPDRRHHAAAGVPSLRSRSGCSGAQRPGQAGLSRSVPARGRNDHPGCGADPHWHRRDERRRRRRSALNGFATQSLLSPWT